MTELARETKPARKRKVRATDENNQRVTLASTLDACRRLADIEVFTLDVAACAASHVASAWYSPEVASKPELLHSGCFGPDGLIADWVGAVWCHPPWSDVCSWVMKAWYEMARGAKGPSVIAMLLPDNRREQLWWQMFVEPHRDGRLSKVHGCTLETHTLAGLQRFGAPGDVAGAKAGGPGYGCALLVWRRLGL